MLCHTHILDLDLEFLSMNLMKTIPLSIILCAAGGGNIAAASDVDIAAVVEAEYSIDVDVSKVEFTTKDIVGAVEKKIQISTKANTPKGILVVTGCAGEGHNITLQKGDGVTLPFTIRRSLADGDFKGGEWKINTDFGNNGTATDRTNIYLKPNNNAIQAVGDYTCSLTITAQAE